MTDLKNRASKAFFWDIVGNYGGQVIIFIISIFLARLLSPEDFGLVGMSMAIIHIFRVFADMGFASALIQNQSNTHLTYSSVFYLNIVIGILFTLLIYLGAPLIGFFYENDRVTTLVEWLSLLFVFNSFNIVQGTILKKKLAFKPISIILLISQFVSGGVAIFMAFVGYGVYALVIQQLLIAILNTIILWNVSEWKPTFQFSWNEVRKITSFSSYLFFGQFLNQLFKQMDTLTVGKLFTPAVLGYYTRAESLNSLISKNSVSTFNRVFFPVLSSLQQEDERFEKVYFQVLDIVSTIAVFSSGLFFLIGDEIIIGLFGQKWHTSVAVFQILVLKGFTYPLNALMVNAFLAKGKAKANFYFGNVRRILQLVPLGVAYFYGFDPFLYSIVSLNVLLWLLNSYFVKVSLKFSFWNQIKKVLMYLGVAASVVLIIDKFFAGGLNYWEAIIKSTIYGLVTISFLILVKSAIIEELVKLWGSLKKRLRK